MATGDTNDIISRLKALLPSRWFGDSPKTVTAILTGWASVHAFIYAQIAYAKLQTRLKTATDGWLDMIAVDFFGTTVHRASGQSDASFLATIQINLFRERGTRAAIIKILQDLTGRTPWIFEPARPADTGAYGGQEIMSAVSAAVYKTDWQGRQLQYPTARINYALQSQALNAAPWTGCNVSASGQLLGSQIPFWNVVKASANPSESCYQAMGSVPDGQEIALTFAFMAGNSSQLDFGLYDTVNGWGAQADTTARIVSGPGTVQANNGGLWRVYGLSTSQPTIVEVTRIYRTGNNPYINLYPDTAPSTVIGNGVLATRVQFERGAAYTSYIPATTAPATVTDYSIDSAGLVTFASAPAAGATLDWTGSGYSALLGKTVTINGVQFGLGDGVQTAWQITRPYGYALGYGAAGGYGSLLLPYQAFVVAYRQAGTGIPSVAGYGLANYGTTYGGPGGYGVGQIEYAAQSMTQGSVADADIYAAIDSVKPAASTPWTRISN